MKQRILTGLTAMLAVLVLTGASFGQTKKQDGTKKRDRDRVCQSVEATPTPIALADRQQRRDRDRADSPRRDRNRDGSCTGERSGSRKGSGGKKSGPQDGSGPRRDGSCQ